MAKELQVYYITMIFRFATFYLDQLQRKHFIWILTIFMLLCYNVLGNRLICMEVYHLPVLVSWVILHYQDLKALSCP